MTRAFLRFASHERIEHRCFPEAAKSLAPERDELGQARIDIAGEHPIDANQYRQREYDRGVQMHDARRAHHKMISCRTWNADEGVTDIITGRGQHDDREKDQPMRQANRQLPDIQPFNVGIFATCYCHGTYMTLTRASSRFVASTTWTPQAIHGSKECTVRRISSGCSGLATGVPTSAAS